MNDTDVIPAPRDPSRIWDLARLRCDARAFAYRVRFGAAQ